MIDTVAVNPQGVHESGSTPKDQTSSITPAGQPSLNMTYTGASQTERTTAGSTNFTYSVLGLGGASSNTFFTRDNRQQLTEERFGAGSTYTAYYYLFDGIGSVVGLTDAGGNLANTYDYDPYGKLLRSTGAIQNPWGFASGYVDSQTGLTKFGMRYFDPLAGNWTQQDSVSGNMADPRNVDRYSYASGSPVNYVDPTGSFAWLLAAVIVWVGFCTATAISDALGINDIWSPRNDADQFAQLATAACLGSITIWRLRTFGYP